MGASPLEFDIAWSNAFVVWAAVIGARPSQGHEGLAPEGRFDVIGFLVSSNNRSWARVQPDKCCLNKVVFQEASGWTGFGL